MLDPTCKLQEWPAGLKDAEYISQQTGVRKDRLIGLAKAGYLPHYQIDEEIRFNSVEVKKWIARNISYKCGGKDLDPQINIILDGSEKANRSFLPHSISNIPNLRTAQAFSSGIYFLCKNSEVVYVGQSVNVAARIQNHYRFKDFDAAFFLPWSPDDLCRIEAAFIRALKPKLNGKVKGGKFLTNVSSDCDDQSMLRMAGFEEIQSLLMSECEAKKG